MTNEQFIQEIGKAKIDKVLKFVFTELSNFIDWYSDGKEINEHYQGELYLLLEKMIGGEKQKSGMVYKRGKSETQLGRR